MVKKNTFNKIQLFEKKISKQLMANPKIYCATKIVIQCLTVKRLFDAIESVGYFQADAAPVNEILENLLGMLGMSPDFLNSEFCSEAMEDLDEGFSTLVDNTEHITFLHLRNYSDGHPQELWDLCSKFVQEILMDDYIDNPVHNEKVKL